MQVLRSACSISFADHEVSVYSLVLESHDLLPLTVKTESEAGDAFRSSNIKRFSWAYHELGRRSKDVVKRNDVGQFFSTKKAPKCCVGINTFYSKIQVGQFHTSFSSTLPQKMGTMAFDSLQTFGHFRAGHLWNNFGVLQPPRNHKGLQLLFFWVLLALPPKDIEHRFSETQRGYRTDMESTKAKDHIDQHNQITMVVKMKQAT